MKIFNVTLTKTFRGESYREPEITSCATEEIANREFQKAVRSELEEYVGSDVTDEDGNPLSFDDFVGYAEEEYELSISETSFTLNTSDESRTSIEIVEAELITE